MTTAIVETLAEVRADGIIWKIVQGDDGRSRCTCKTTRDYGQCRHILAYRRALQHGQSLIVRDSIGPILVSLKTEQPEYLREAYALAITLLPQAPASEIHKAAEQIAAYADKYRDRTRVRQKPTGRTRIIVVDE